MKIKDCQIKRKVRFTKRKITGDAEKVSLVGWVVGKITVE